MSHHHEDGSCELCGNSGIASVGFGPELCRCIRERLRLLESLALKYPLPDPALDDYERCTHCWQPLGGMICGGGKAPPGSYHSTCYNKVVDQIEAQEKVWEEARKRLESKAKSASSSPNTQ